MSQGQDKKIILHYSPVFNESAEIEVVLREREWTATGEEYDWMSTDYDVLIDGEAVDILTRDPKHRTYQVHSRIRYDNSPRTRFKARKYSVSYQDTRNEALGDIFEGLGMTRERLSVHLPGRNPWWRSCSICEDAT